MRSERVGRFFLVVLALLVMAGQAYAGAGFRGVTRVRTAAGGLGKMIAGVKILFVSEDGKVKRGVRSTRKGRYSIRLKPARYYVTAKRRGYKSYSSKPGFFVYKGKGWQTGNIFLKRRRRPIYKFGGFRGTVLRRKKNGSIGKSIPGAKITFTSEKGKTVRVVKSDKKGRYKIRLRKGRYYVLAQRRGYKRYTSKPGFFVCKGKGWQTGNIFLRKAFRPHFRSWGYRGRVLTRLSNGKIGPPIPGAKITFTHENGRRKKIARSGKKGWYKIRLFPGRYRVKARRNFFLPYSSYPGFFVVKGKAWQTGNIFHEIGS